VQAEQEQQLLPQSTDAAAAAGMMDLSTTECLADAHALAGAGSLTPAAATAMAAAEAPLERASGASLTESVATAADDAGVDTYDDDDASGGADAQQQQQGQEHALQQTATSAPGAQARLWKASSSGCLTSRAAAGIAGDKQPSAGLLSNPEGVASAVPYNDGVEVPGALAATAAAPAAAVQVKQEQQQQLLQQQPQLAAVAAIPAGKCTQAATAAPAAAVPAAAVQVKQEQQQQQLLLQQPQLAASPCNPSTAVTCLVH
jgi:hypothetical protein